MSLALEIFGFLCWMIVPVLLVVSIIRAIKKKPIKKLLIASGALVILGIVLLVIGISTDPQEKCEHEYLVTEDIAATCTTDGKLKETCSKCGKVKTTERKATGHQMVEVSRTEPTDTVDGQIVNRCSVCGYEEISIIPHPEPTTVVTTEAETTTAAPTTAASTTVAPTTVAQTTAAKTEVQTTAVAQVNEKEDLTYLLMASGNDVESFIDSKKLSFAYDAEIGHTYCDSNEEFYLSINNANQVMAIVIQGYDYGLFGLACGNAWGSDAIAQLKKNGFSQIDEYGDYCECTDSNGRNLTLYFELSGNDTEIISINFVSFNDTADTDGIVETTAESTSANNGEYRDSDGDFDAEALSRDLENVLGYDLDAYDSSLFPSKYSKERQKVVDILNAYKNNQINGYYVETSMGKLKETLNKSNWKYYGEMKDNMPHGFGLVIAYGEKTFCGEFKNGKPSGYGMVFDADENGKNDVYEGDDCSAKLIGQLVRFRASGDGFIYDDAGSYIFTDGPHLVYEGELDENERDGKGIEYKSASYVGGHGAVIYEGKFKDDKYSGKGVLYYENGTKKYEGEFEKGLYDGKGTLYNQDGSVKYSGKFSKGDIK